MKTKPVWLGHFRIAVLQKKLGTSSTRGKAHMRESELPSSFLSYHRQQTPLPQQGPTGNKEKEKNCQQCFVRKYHKGLL